MSRVIKTSKPFQSHKTESRMGVNEDWYVDPRYGQLIRSRQNNMDSDYPLVIAEATGIYMVSDEATSNGKIVKAEKLVIPPQSEQHHSTTTACE